jgi:HPt (histidine-containing phosphotransfer) domain-containing protein
MTGVQATRRADPRLSQGTVGDIVDLEHLARQTMNDPELERQVVGMFFEQSALILRQVREAASPRQRSDAAHKLKGSAKAIGAWRVAEASSRVESLPVTAPDDHVLDAVAGLHATVAEARAAIAGLLQGGSTVGL